MFIEPPAGSAIPGLGSKPGAANCGRGIKEALDVIGELTQAEIPSVVVGPRALVYYGAKRAPKFWDICVPDHLHGKATAMFASESLSEKYDSWPRIMPQGGTMIHSYSCFTLKGVNFFFYISTTFDHRVSCDPEKCEMSKLGVPYPKLELFAQSLLETNRFHDLENLVDGMNLTEEWGDEHLNFSLDGLKEYAKEKNKRIRETLPESDTKMSTFGMAVCPNPLALWQKLVRNKEKRIGIELPKEKYETRFRIRGSGDPRLRDRQV
jgi:hypothetical protein